MERSLIDLGTTPLGHTLPSADFDADRLEFLVDALPIVEFPVVLGVDPRHESAEQQSAAVERGRLAMTSDGLLPGGRVHPDVATWAQMLEQPDWYVSARLIPRPYDETAQFTRICLAGNDIGRVFAERFEHSLRLRAVTGSGANTILDALGRASAFDFPGISAPTDLLSEALDAAPTDAPATAARLTHIGIDEQAATAVASALSTCSAHAEITSVSVGPGTRTPGAHPVSFFDTHRGRILATSSTASDGRQWSSLAPGTDARIMSALSDMISRAGG